MDTFKCGKCKLVLPSGEFPPSQQGNGKWCKACYREWHRSRYTPSTGATDEPRACAVCHVVYSPSARRLSKFCSVACKNAAKNASHTADLHAAKPARTCVWCAADMPQTMRSDAKYCSADCNMQAHRRTRNYRRRAGAGAPVKPRKQPLVNLADIAARDKFRCGICGQRVDMGRKYPDPGFPSLDHVTPLSAGGDALDPSNLRLAHLRCNVTLRDKGTSQLRLM